MLFGDAALVEGLVAFGWEGVSVERDEGVFCAVLLEGVVEGEQAGEIGGIGYQRCPDCEVSAFVWCLR